MCDDSVEKIKFKPAVIIHNEIIKSIANVVVYVIV